MIKTTPPKWAERFLKWFCREDLLEYIHGDLQESFEQSLEDLSYRKARWKYIKEVLGLFRPGIIRSFELNHPFAMNISMLGNYIKIALRQIKRHKLFSGLNIFGLATSMAICLLVIMILVDQYSYDQFHENKHKIFRVHSLFAEKDQTINKNHLTATTTLQVAEELEKNYPFVDKITRIRPIYTKDVSTETKILPLKGHWVDQDFLEIFSFEWKKGNQQKALSSTGSVVITEKTAYKYFEEADPIGKTLSFGDWGDYIVAGVIADPPHRSHIQFEFLLPALSLQQLYNEGVISYQINDWTQIWDAYVYLQMNDQAEDKDLELALNKIAAAQTDASPNLQFVFAPQAFTSISPIDFDIMNQMNPTIPIQILYFLMGLGAVVMISACFNYTNLSIARSLKRAKEIGIRKVIGAKRQHIMGQFLIESVLISWLALGLAIGLLEFLIYGFYEMETELHQFILLPRDQPQIYLYFLGFSTLVGLIAGLLPAIHLSSFQPIQILKSLSNIKLFSHLGLRKALIVIQLSFSIIFVTATLVLFFQQSHMTDIDVGIRTNNIVNVELQGMKFDLFAEEISKISGVESVSASKLIPATGSMNSESAWISGGLDTTSLSYNMVSQNYIDNMELSLIAGGNFPTAFTEENEKWTIISETAVRKLGLTSPDSAIGQTVMIGKETPLLVIGVMKDFHHMGVMESPRPYALRLSSNRVRYANVRVHEGNLLSTVDQLSSTWEELDPVHEFSFHFYDEKVQERFKILTLGGRIIGLVSFLAVIIACLGMLGMAVYEVEGKTKEIGIRKVLGASEKTLVWKLSRGFLFLLGIAVVVGIPISYFLADMWLQNFHYRISVGLGVMGLGVLLIFLPSMVAIISQTYGAAKANPVDSLRME